ncbi:TetR/AcrR family transcriptional regulator [Actinocorallia sp. A-T 12471]|uniref:TetR/AcrR family transcriptional regulator n=1 Tax=Actinocorallia sp. A-T 12471 TaxID=3089813 RepID=UPI0029CACB45|nr:TetR family transcriptional regulator [Actinocorallia sp. A-T 12471]MDX6742208.1 TetR family transcriptional regulator [Actinocorallia sp. A-T 12471]
MTRATHAREKILNAAERLFAERGFEVSLREIAGAAGQRNNSAVQYHFGDKTGLVDALYEFRMTPLNVRRREMIAELRAAGREGDLPALVEAFLGPLSEHVLTHRGESWYLRFTSRYVLSGGYRSWPFSSDHYPGMTELVPLLFARLPGLTEERLRAMFLHMLVVLADLEQRYADPGFDDAAAAAAAADLRTTCLAVLTAGGPE